jgi:integrase/recombinase XerC
MNASIFQRGTRFYVDIYDSGQSPKRKQYSLGTEDEREATRLLLDLQDAIEAGAWQPWQQTAASFLSQSQGSDGSIECSAALQRWLGAKRSEECSPNTIRTYKGVVDLFLRRHNLTDAPVSAVRRDHCEAYIRQGDLSRATRRKRYRFLRAFFNWLIREGYLDASPLEKVKAPKRGKKLPKALRREELKALCRKASPWFARLLRFAVYSGLRPSELGRLRWSDIDFERGLIYIYQQKNGSESTVPLTDAARDVLKEMEAGEGLIFNREGRKGTSWTEHLSQRFLRLRREVGLREELSMYSTRHATATILCEEGVSPVFVQQMMRHADLSTTMRYVHLANERVKDEVKGVF